MKKWIVAFLVPAAAWANALPDGDAPCAFEAARAAVSKNTWALISKMKESDLDVSGGKVQLTLPTYTKVEQPKKDKEISKNGVVDEVYFVTVGQSDTYLVI